MDGKQWPVNLGNHEHLFHYIVHQEIDFFSLNIHIDVIFFTHAQGNDVSLI